MRPIHAALVVALLLSGCSWGRTMPCACTVPAPPAELMRPLPPLPPIPMDLPVTK